jgi:hypothetical protein
MDAVTRIAEERIRQAIAEGEFANLSGAGRPLIFEDETWVPEDLRLAYRFLKNAGFVPPELELRNEIITLRDLIETIDDERKAPEPRRVSGLRAEAIRKKDRLDIRLFLLLLLRVVKDHILFFDVLILRLKGLHPAFFGHDLVPGLS